MTSIMRMVRLHLFGSENDHDQQQRVKEDVSFLQSAHGTYGAIGDAGPTHPQQDDASSSKSVKDQETVRVAFSKLPSYQADVESPSFDVFKHNQFAGNDIGCELTDEETTSVVSDEESFTVGSHFCRMVILTIPFRNRYSDVLPPHSSLCTELGAHPPR